MPKAPAKKTAKRTAKTTAKVAVPAEASATPVAPAAAVSVGYLTPEVRQARSVEISLVETAVRKASASGRPSGRNLCWSRLPAALAREIAVEHIVDRVSADGIWNARAETLSSLGVTKTSYFRWTRDLRAAFDAEYTRHTKGRATVDHKIWNSGDLVANMGVWYAQIAPLMTVYANERLTCDGGPSKDELGCVLRFSECVNEAAKVQAEAKLKERQTLLLALKAANEKGLKAKTTKDKEQAIRDSVALVDAIIRGEVAA